MSVGADGNSLSPCAFEALNSVQRRREIRLEITSLDRKYGTLEFCAIKKAGGCGSSMPSRQDLTRLQNFIGLDIDETNNWHGSNLLLINVSASAQCRDYFTQTLCVCLAKVF